MPNLGGDAPYYGGGQVPNPANVTQIYSDPPKFKAALGSLAVNSSTESVYIAIAEDGSSPNKTVWAELSSSANPGDFPITPFVVGPVGVAGYQTIQTAMTAANAAGGGMIYVQPGSYTENLTWYTGVYICSLPPESLNPSTTFPVTITGNHTIVGGTRGSHLWATSGIDFVCTGNLFTSALTTPLNTSLTDCTINASEFIFSMPSIDPSTNSSFTLTRINVFGGGTSAVTLRGSTFITDCQLSLNGVSPLTLGSGVTTITSSTIEELLINPTGNIFGIFSFFNDTVTLSSSSAGSGVFQSSYFSSADSCVIFNDGAGGTFESCELLSGATYTISGNSPGTISITETNFTSSSPSYIDPALTGVVWNGTVQTGVFMAAQALVSGIASITGVTNGTVITAPPASATATAALGAITLGVPIRNLLGYDVVVSGNIVTASATGLTFYLGVGPSATPAPSPITDSITNVNPFYTAFSAYVPSGYYLSLGVIGTGGPSTIFPVVTPV